MRHECFKLLGGLKVAGRGRLICPFGIPHLCSRCFLVASGPTRCRQHTLTNTPTDRQSFYFCEKTLKNECLSRVAQLGVANVNRLLVNLMDEAAPYSRILDKNKVSFKDVIYIQPQKSYPINQNDSHPNRKKPSLNISKTKIFYSPKQNDIVSAPDDS